MSINGTYEFVEMEAWSKDAVDLIEPGYIDIQGKRGYLHFVCVDGDMDIEKVDDKYRFSWNGNDDGDPAGGHGYFTHSAGTLTGRVCIHDGDESSFVARKTIPVSKMPVAVNRSSIVVKAKEPFRKWVYDLQAPQDISIEYINEDSTIYLIQVYDDDRQRDRILKKIYSSIFEGQLNEWCAVRSTWPEKRTFAVFKKWFDVEFHSIVEDLEKNEVEHEYEHF